MNHSEVAQPAVQAPVKGEVVGSNPTFGAMNVGQYPDKFGGLAKKLRRRRSDQ